MTWTEAEISDIALAADANFVRHAGWIQAATDGMSVSDDARLAVIDSGFPCDTFNFACRARLSSAAAPGRARGAVQYFRDAKRPFSWWVGPADLPADLGQLLQAIGLERAETELAMAIDLGEVTAPDPVSGLEILRVGSHDELSHFARILSELWTPLDPNVVAFYTRAAPQLLTDECPMQCYVAYLQGLPVGTVEMTLGGGVAGLYNIATVPEYRRRGIGSWLTVYPLLDARASGINVGVLQAAAQGVGIYERVGFQRFGAITEYKPPAAWFDA